MKQSILKRLQRLWQTIREANGFTMIELMIVVTIIAILSGVSITVYRNYLQRTRVTATKSQIRQFEPALETIGRYPSSEEGLQMLVDEGLIKRSGLNDPWGNPYQYRCPGEEDRPYDIWSFGADGKPGGEGFNKDINNWELD